MPRERRCPLNPGIRGSPLGYDGSFERPLTSEGPIQSSPNPQGSVVREAALHEPPETIFRARYHNAGIKPRLARKSAGIPGDEGCLDT